MRPFPLMLFAAGLGTRMGVLTQSLPKPLIPVAGVPLIDHAIAVADDAGIMRRVMNLHYKGDLLATHVAGRNIGLSWESGQILETGGGLRAALPMLGSGPVLVLNTDAVWTGLNPLVQLLNGWDDAGMDALLLLLPVEKATGHLGSGDFLMNPEGRLSRAGGMPGLVYLGAQIIRTETLDGFPEAVFSLNRVWDRMIGLGRVFGLVHQGGWCDVGRPDGIASAESLLAKVDDVS